MKIIHRFAIRPTDLQRAELIRNGIQFTEPADSLGLIVIKYDESDHHWPIVASIVEKWDVIELVTTKFSKQEFSKAKCLRMESTWHHGYPQPEDAFGYKNTTYDNTRYCLKCGTGLIQQAPFCMLREPKWGTKKILQLNWVFDEFFVTTEAWEKVFHRFGIEKLPVLQNKTGHPLKSVVQLKVLANAKPMKEAESYVSECCSVCKRVKFMGHSRGPFPYVELPEGAHIAKTQEYFGSGGSAWHSVIVSAALYIAIIENKLKGVDFKVVAPCS